MNEGSYRRQAGANEYAYCGPSSTCEVIDQVLSIGIASAGLDIIPSLIETIV